MTTLPGSPSPDAESPRPRPEAIVPPELLPLSDQEDETEPKKKKKKKDKDKSSGGGTSRGIETMFRMVYQTHLELSAMADTKANIMISINGLMISVILASIGSNLARSPWLAMPVGVVLAGCLVSLIYSVLAARPRVGSEVVPLEALRSRRANILFFGNFVHMPETDFLEGIGELMVRTDEVYRTMARDIYSLGSVLSRKYRLLRIAYNTFMAGLVAGVLVLLAVLILRPGAVV
ncbi:MAG: DUF5706 domain-containing protein [Gemmatimonadales bacterium]|nr:DUF5706 domain-containing protein [Gemmatimonadales bacterium]